VTGITGTRPISSLFEVNAHLQSVHNELNSIKNNLKEGKLSPSEIKKFIEIIEKVYLPGGFTASNAVRGPDQQIVKNVLSAIEAFHANFSTSKAGQEVASPVVVAFFKSLSKLKSGLSKAIKKKKVDQVEKVEGANNEDMDERGGRKGS
jgi:hypothetical protein